jgi:pilus assembly protein Flp/PilA
MLRLWTAYQSRFVREEGASMVEYGLLVALIAVVAIAAVTLVGGAVRDNFEEVATSLS